MSLMRGGIPGVTIGRCAFLVAIALVVAGPGSAQLAVEDRAAVAAEALRALSDSAHSPMGQDVRLWLRGWSTPAGSEWSHEDLSEAVLAAVQKGFPRAQAVDRNRWLYDCERETAERANAGIACPILDGGRIITFATTRDQPEDEGLTRVSITMIREGRPGRTAALQWGVDLRKTAAGGWTAERVALRLTT
jgi:hypothetical protein